MFRLFLHFVMSGLSMKVSEYNGLIVAVLLGEQEHCPPHVHVEHDGWDARFIFSFLHNDVELWAFDSSDKLPPKGRTEKLRQHIEIPGNLKKAREIWLKAHGAGKLEICLNNKYWDPANLVEVDGSNAKKGMYQIQKAVFDSNNCLTTLTFIGGQEAVGIQL
jgi:hypothetical protein